jgi:hypothetical protein
MLGATDTENLIRLAGWAGLALAALMVFAIVAHWLRKRIHRASLEEQTTGLDLDRLKQMHETGRITDREYGVLRARTLEGYVGRKSGKGPG